MRKRLSITRRDFLNGASIAVAAGAGLSPAQLLAEGYAGAHPSAPPPTLTGLRGSHAGSFEVAHSVAWAGKQWPRPKEQTDDTYDLIVVGAGLSGLAAAFLYRQQAGASARILILDNHDDFGGHAKRNEFNVDGKFLIGYGGSQSIDSPGTYSPASKKLLTDLGVDVSRFYDYFDQEFYSRLGLREGLFFDKAHYGVDRLVDMPFMTWAGKPKKSAAKHSIDAFPWPEEERKAFADLVFKSHDFLHGKSDEEKIDLLRKTSYETYLRDYAKAPESSLVLFRRTLTGLWGVGWDALSALEATRWSMPGTEGLKIKPEDEYSEEHDEPYIFHFPDGNASLARLFVRALIPDAVPGSSMEDIVLVRVDYNRLDTDGSPARIRLLSTAVDVRHAPDGKAVDIVYVNGGKTYRARGRHAVMAGYNVMLPYICPEMGDEQKSSIRAVEKIPLVYTNVALRNWRPFVEAGYSRAYAPQALFESLALDFPVSIGDYKFAQTPDDPMLLHMTYVPTEPGLTEREQHRAGRQKLYGMSFDDFEDGIVEQLSGMLGPHGFDAERDIAAITVNRWPHGYAYEYNELYDPADWSPKNGPHLKGRAPIGRISIANSDSSAYAYVNGAFDAAVRAVGEQLSV